MLLRLSHAALARLPAHPAVAIRVHTLEDVLGQLGDFVVAAAASSADSAFTTFSDSARIVVHQATMFRALVATWFACISIPSEEPTDLVASMMWVSTPFAAFDTP